MNVPPPTSIQTLVPALLAAHAGATLLMTGLDWFVHAVHYPMFATAAQAGDEHYRAFQREHLRRTAPLIPPIMLIEAATAVTLLIVPGESIHRPLAWLGLALLGIVWIATFAGAVPMHRRLERGFDGTTHRWLLRFDLVRAIAWTGRSVVALLLMLGIDSRAG